jgi:NCAIR mutase (PurE)-related protein
MMFDQASIEKLIRAVAAREVSPEACIEKLRSMPFESSEHSLLDHHRALRCGLAEVVFCPGKTEKQVAEILQRLARHHDRVLATRATAAQYEAAKSLTPELKFHETAKAIWLDRSTEPKSPGVVVAAAGTVDLGVAEEAALTAELMGNAVARIFDVGVAGLHRLLPHVATIQNANVIVAVAGMEGALPSVIGGLAGRPVIAVPTSAGYGASFGGVAALLAMLNSCASGVTVVNIDNGFGAGFAAGLVNQRCAAAQKLSS